MYCRNCGKQITDDSVFCRYCGKQQQDYKKQSTIYTFDLLFTERYIEASTNDENEMTKCKDLYYLQGLMFKLEDNIGGRIPPKLKDMRYMHIVNYNIFDISGSLGAFGKMLINNLIIGGWKIQPTNNHPDRISEHYLFIKEA